MNILFTSIGRRVELVRAFRRAYESLGLNGRIVGIDIDPLAPALQLADEKYIVPRINSPDYVATLVRICHRERIRLVFPLIDPDVIVLARHRQRIEASGARMAVVGEAAANITSDKWRTFEFFEKLGLPTPHSWLPGQLDPDRAEYPLFIKPRDGSAAKHVYKVHTPEELAFFSGYVPDPIVQEFLPGPEITTDVICKLDGQMLAIVSRQRLEVRSGEVSKGVTVFNAAVRDGCIQIARALPAVGPITVQCMLKDGGPYFTEINARLGGGIPLGIAAGVDAPRWLLAGAAGLPVDLPPLGAYRTGLYLTRYDDSYFLTEVEREQMARGHL